MQSTFRNFFRNGSITYGASSHWAVENDIFDGLVVLRLASKEVKWEFLKLQSIFWMCLRQFPNQSLDFTEVPTNNWWCLMSELCIDFHLCINSSDSWKGKSAVSCISKCPKAKTPFKLTQEAQSLVPVQLHTHLSFTTLCYYLKFHMKCFIVKNKQKGTDFQWLK